jgi:tetratricopeptide (TPR) repeat protein
LRFINNTLQATLTVCITLVVAFVVTGFASSAYHRKRDALGTQHYDRGHSLETHGDLEAALEEYRKALLFAPDNAQYRLSLATALLEANRLEEAQSHLEQLLQEDPTSGEINILLGRLAVLQRKPKEAVEYYQRGVYEYWPESEFGRRRQARWELVSLLSKAGDRTGFVGELMQLYANLPRQDINQKLKVGFLLVGNGATSEASRIFEDLVKDAPQNGEVRRGLAEVNFGAGDYITARHEFQHALKLDPHDADSSKGLALTNDVIDMDAALPYITSAEQTRRNKNLLSRVIKNLEECRRGAGNSARLDDARRLLSQIPKDEDPAFVLQTTAARLWRDRANLCGTSVPQDPALDTVLTRLGRA